MAETRSPDFNVTAMLKNEQTVKGRIGAGWKNKDGSISIRLDNFIVLDSLKEPMIRLWPVADKPKSSRPEYVPDVNDDDDRPF